MTVISAYPIAEVPAHDSRRSTEAVTPAERRQLLGNSLFLSLCLLIALFSRTDNAAADRSSDHLIDGVVSRSSAVYQGQFTFRVTEQRGIAGSALQLVRSDNYALTIAGTDWLLRYDKSPNRIMTRDGSTVRYYEAHSPEGAEQHGLHIDAPLSIDAARGSNVVYTVPRHGTFWYPEQTLFVDAQRQQAQSRGDEFVSGIRVHVLQWQVSANDFDEGFLVIPPSIAEQRKGLLRIYVAPDLGYALPRIEYCTLDGRVAKQIESTDFFEVEGGLHFPRQTKCTTFLENETFLTTVKIDDTRYVNTSIPADVFAFDIPANTRVRDSRPGLPKTVFHLDDDMSLAEFETTIQAAPPDPPWFSWQVLGITVNSLIVIVLLLIWIRRKRRTEMQVLSLAILLCSLPSSPGWTASGPTHYTLADVYSRAEQHRTFVQMCGPLSALRMLSLMGHKVHPRECLDQYQRANSEGVPLQEVVDLVRRFEENGRAVQMTDLRLDRVPLPSILLVNQGRHCVVLESLSEHAALIWDPSDMRHKKLPQEILQSMWCGKAILTTKRIWSPAALALLAVGHVGVVVSAGIWLAHQRRILMRRLFTLHPSSSAADATS